MRALSLACCLALMAALVPTAALASDTITVDIVTGSSVGGHVKVFSGSTLTLLQSFLPYGGYTGGVRVASGDVNGDGVGDVITAIAAGGPPHVEVFDGTTGALIRSFFAYSPSFTGGVFVAAGDLDGDGYADIVTGSGSGGHVKAFSGQTGAETRSFLPYGGFGGGVTVAVGDVNNDGQPDIITGTDAFAHVKVFDGGTLAEIRSFLPYGSFTGGVYVAAGDVNGDGADDIVTGASVNGHVKVFDGLTGAEIRSFLAYGGFNGGVYVAAGDLSGDGRAEIVTGNSVAPHVKVFDGVTTAELASFFAYSPSAGGVFVATRASTKRQGGGGDSDGDGIPDAADPDTVAGVLETLPAGALSAGHSTATLARLDAAEAMILAGETGDAIQQLRNLLRRFDGCPSDPTISGQADKDDWVLDCDAQRSVADSLRGVIAALGG